MVIEPLTLQLVDDPLKHSNPNPNPVAQLHQIYNMLFMLKYMSTCIKKTLHITENIFADLLHVLPYI